jgi:hypothetical protein
MMMSLVSSILFVRTEKTDPYGPSRRNGVAMDQYNRLMDALAPIALPLRPSELLRFERNFHGDDFCTNAFREDMRRYYEDSSAPIPPRYPATRTVVSLLKRL